MNADGSDAKLHDLNTDRPLEDVSAEHPELFGQMRDIAKGIYETTKYQFYYNTVEEARKRGAQ
jgi:hypothetical protein